MTRHYFSLLPLLRKDAVTRYARFMSRCFPPIRCSLRFISFCVRRFVPLICHADFDANITFAHIFATFSCMRKMRLFDKRRLFFFFFFVTLDYDADA